MRFYGKNEVDLAHGYSAQNLIFLKVTLLANPYLSRRANSLCNFQSRTSIVNLFTKQNFSVKSSCRWFFDESLRIWDIRTGKFFTIVIICFLSYLINNLSIKLSLFSSQISLSVVLSMKVYGFGTFEPVNA